MNALIACYCIILALILLDLIDTTKDIWREMDRQRKYESKEPEEKEEKQMKYLEQFVDNFKTDFDNQKVIIDIRKVSKIRLRIALFQNYVGNLDDLDNANFIWISGGNLHVISGLALVSDSDWKLVALKESDGEYYWCDVD